MPKFRAPRRYNVLAHEDLHQASYKPSFVRRPKVRFAGEVRVAKPVVLAPGKIMWYKDQDYELFVLESQRDVKLYRNGHSVEVRGLEEAICPMQQRLGRLKSYQHVMKTLAATRSQTLA